MRRRIKRRRVRASAAIKKLRSPLLAVLRWSIAPATRAVAGTLAGGTVIAVGAAMIYTPAGLLLGGAELVVYCVRLIDVPPKER